MHAGIQSGMTAAHYYRHGVAMPTTAKAAASTSAKTPRTITIKEKPKKTHHKKKNNSSTSNNNKNDNNPKTRTKTSQSFSFPQPKVACNIWEQIEVPAPLSTRKLPTRPLDREVVFHLFGADCLYWLDFLGITHIYDVRHALENPTPAGQSVLPCLGSIFVYDKHRVHSDVCITANSGKDQSTGNKKPKDNDDKKNKDKNEDNNEWHFVKHQRHRRGKPSFNEGYLSQSHKDNTHDGSCSTLYDINGILVLKDESDEESASNNDNDNDPYRVQWEIVQCWPHDQVQEATNKDNNSLSIEDQQCTMRMGRMQVFNHSLMYCDALWQATHGLSMIDLSIHYHELVFACPLPAEFLKIMQNTAEIFTY